MVELLLWVIPLEQVEQELYSNFVARNEKKTGKERVGSFMYRWRNGNSDPVGNVE